MEARARLLGLRRYAGAFALAILVAGLSGIGSGEPETHPGPLPAEQGPRVPAAARPVSSLGGSPPAGAGEGSAPSPASSRPAWHPPTLGPAAPKIVPYAWHGLPTPPGAEVFAGAARSAHVPAGWGGSGSEWQDLAEFCYGVWPSGGQGQYLPGCYGHDEPGLDAYSTLPGSGGNVTWTLRLPVGTDAGENQSDLYDAVWFGLPLADPYAWMGLCYLELQLYPDSSWTSVGSDLNHWIGAAVGWQIEASNFQEDPCFYEPLQVEGIAGDYLTLAGGDQLEVRMNGWPGSATGETLLVADNTTGEKAFVTLYNSTAGLPLDPAYLTSAFPNSLLWTPGGELPIAFAFETGHAVAPYPDNNTYGGCSAGVPPSGPRDPAVPCPSYDPGSWINDTASPLDLSPPTFYNLSSDVRASQVAFTQDLGGISFIDAVSNGSCDGADASAWCSYPWFSYSCTENAFQFGATDWPTTSADFGKYEEYRSRLLEDRAGLEYYPPTNASVPACASPAYRLTVGPSPSGGGTVGFLNGSVAQATVVPGLLAGTYALAAVPGPGSVFLAWTTGGDASVDLPDSPVAAVTLTGDGSVTATFGAARAPVKVILWAPDNGGSFQIAPGAAGNGTVPAYDVPNGASVALAPGLYTLNALPTAGHNFTSWGTGPGAYVAAPFVPVTWLVVSGASAWANVTANFSASLANATVYVTQEGEGGFLLGDYGFGTTSFRLPVGTHPFALYPDPGSLVEGFYLAGDALSLDLGNNGSMVLDGGPLFVEIVFAPAVNLSVSPGTAEGEVAVAGGAFVGAATSLTLYSAPVNVTLAALPEDGEQFLGWSDLNHSAAWVHDPAAAVTFAQVNASVDLVAEFGADPDPPGLRFAVTPSDGGSVLLDGRVFGNGSSDAELAAGLYLLGFAAAPGQELAGFSVALGSSSVLSGTSYGWPVGTELLDLEGPSSGTLEAVADRDVDPVSFYEEPHLPGLHVVVNGSSQPFGSTARLLSGSYLVHLAGHPTLPLRSWTTAGGLALRRWNATVARIWVNGSGSLYATFGPVLNLSASAAPVGIDLLSPLSVGFNATVTGGDGGPYSYQWAFGPPGAASTKPAPRYTYVAGGVFHWTLTVRDAGGNTTYANGTLVVGEIEPLTLAASVATPPGLVGEAPYAAAFALSAQGGAFPYAFRWALPALGANGTGAHVAYTFLTPGNYTFALTVTDGLGDQADANVSVEVFGRLATSLAADPVAGAAPLEVRFTALPTNGSGGDSYLWTFGDGEGGSGVEATHVYEAAGTYTASLEVEDSLGFQAAAHATIDVGSPPPPLSVALRLDPASLRLGATTNVSATATGGVPFVANGVASYRFAFAASSLPPGCGASGQASFLCTPTSIGAYELEVTVTDAAGTTNSSAAELEVLPAPSPPGGPSTPGPLGGVTLPELVAGGIVLLLVAAASLVVVRGRARPRAPSPPAPEEAGTEEAPEEELGEGATPWP